MFIDGRTLRLQARTALKGKWQTAMLAAFLSSIFSTIAQVIFSMNLAKVLPSLLRLFEQGYPVEYIITQIDEAQFILPTLMSAFAFLVGPSLVLGLNRLYLTFYQNKEASILSVFSGLKQFFRALWLTIMISFLTLLPYLVVLLLLLVVIPLMQVTYSFVNTFSSILTFAASFMVVRTALRYMPAPIIIAENPNVTARQALKMSRKGMKNELGRLFAFFFFFFLLSFGITYLDMFLPNMIGGVLATVLTLFLQLSLNVYLQMTLIAYYLNRYEDFQLS